MTQTSLSDIVTLMGQRLTKRDPIVSSTNLKEMGVKIGDVIDDGKNLPMHLATGYPRHTVELMKSNLEVRFPKKVWKFWIV